MNIILTGMPASGKSTVGVILAKVLGCDFVDTDLLIQRREKACLKDIIRAKGNDAFLDIEADVCKSLQTENTVIATGGSVIYRDEAMRHLKSLGVIVYLKVGTDALKSRLHDMEDLIEERSCLYERYADITLDESDLGLEETVQLVRSSIMQLC